MKFEIKDLSVPADALKSEGQWNAGDEDGGSCMVCTLTTPDDDDDRTPCPAPTRPQCPPPTNAAVADGIGPAILAHQDELNRLLNQPQA